MRTDVPTNIEEFCVSFIGLTLATAFLDTGQLANFDPNVFIRFIFRGNRIICTYTAKLKIYVFRD